MREALPIAAAAFAIVLALWLSSWWRGFVRTIRLRRRFARAQAGERRAAHVLAAYGFTVVASQARARWAVLVGDERVEVDLRADYLVTRRGLTYVAEVKTGRVAPRIASGATRRQLLEYRCAFGVDGALLVDAEADVVHEVVFALPAPRAQKASLVWIATAATLGFLAARYVH